MLDLRENCFSHRCSYSKAGGTFAKQWRQVVTGRSSSFRLTYAAATTNAPTERDRNRNKECLVIPLQKTAKR